MKTLSELHFDALAESIKIGTERAAQGLNQMISTAAQSSAPIVELTELDDVTVETLRLNAEEFGFVTQKSTGALTADVFLLFAEDDALRLVQNMLGAEMDIDTVRECENEAMCELGNIMINACLSSIADSLHIPIESSLPQYETKSGEEIVTFIQRDKSQEFVLTSHFNLSIEEQPAEGKLVFLMNSASCNSVGQASVE